MALNTPDLPFKQILSSRSFAKLLTDKEIIKTAAIFQINGAHAWLSKQRLGTALHTLRYEDLPYLSIKGISYAIGLEYSANGRQTINPEIYHQINVLFRKIFNIKKPPSCSVPCMKKCIPMI
ncbi:hypothetical protein [Acinetobacter sp.]|jgi:DNA polymerase V|uniref:hypothetical protein n=1 Tax=Acinetobacter sp. TaxID=472 RepID=UPI0035B2E2A0